jgi:hypothetical protein
MKPREARAMVRAQEAAREARGEALEHFLRTGEPRDEVRPDLIPGAPEHRVASREVRRLTNLARRAPAGPRRNGLLDELTVAMRRLIFVERVIEMDPLLRASLTPADLVRLSTTTADDVQALYLRMAGKTGRPVLPGEGTG